jgi:hypothetical protein
MKIKPSLFFLSSCLVISVSARSSAIVPGKGTSDRQALIWKVTESIWMESDHF